MPTTEQNIAAVRGVYAAFAAGDAERALAAFAPDFVLHEPESLPYGGTYHGIAELAAALPQIAPYINVAELRVERVLADNDTAVAYVHGRWKAETDTEFRECFAFRDDGLITEMRIFAWDTAALPH
jgi:ketosteroid isomerase-like protein